MKVTERTAATKSSSFRDFCLAKSIVQPDRGRREVLRVVERVRGIEKISHNIRISKEIGFV